MVHVYHIVLLNYIAIQCKIIIMYLVENNINRYPKIGIDILAFSVCSRHLSMFIKHREGWH